MNSFGKNFDIMGMSWLLFFSAVTFFAYIQELLYIPLIYPFALTIGSICYLYYLRKKGVSQKIICINSFAIFVCIAIATVLHDFSWDGQAYHMEAIWQLANGWNIYYDAPLSDVNIGGHAIWLNSYPKATWMFGAALYAVTGSLLSCKSYMFILVVGNVLLAHDILSYYTTNKWFSRGILFVLVANPVVSAQLWSTYLDGALYLLCLAVSLLLIKMAVKGFAWDTLLLAVITSAIAFNFKFTSVAYVGLIWLCFAAYAIIVNRKIVRRILAVAITSAALGLLFLGYNPYITNFVYEGHPFWPIRGTHDLQNVMLACGDADFIEQNRFVKFGSSLFARSSNKNANMDNVEYKIPFTVSLEEIKTIIANTDTRIGGFGVFFSGIVVLAFIALFFCDKSVLDAGFFCIAFFVFMSIVINPESWVARYAPQTYLLPIMILFALHKVNNYRTQIFANVLLIIMIVNSAVIFVGMSGFQLYAEYKDYKTFESIKQYPNVMVWSSGMFDSILETRFKYHNVNYVYSETPTKDSQFDINWAGRKNTHIRVWQE